MPSAPLPPVSRYLWAQGPPELSLPAGTMLAGRYQVIQFPLIQDLQPDEPPTPLETVPLAAEPYLALSRFLIAVPRPFTQVISPDGKTPLLLLEEVPLQILAGTDGPTLLPTLPEVWAGATALHQLTWLWRIAKLWQSCVDHEVGHSLLDWQNLRVDGEDVRLLLLSRHQTSPPTLKDLGHHWRQLAPTAAPPIGRYLAHLIDLLTAGKGSPDSLINALIGAIENLSLQQEVAVQLATYSDQGPTRQRNEDACYPNGGFAGQVTIKAAALDQAAAPLMIVCDGVGGHQGGDVASHTAIAEVAEALSELAATPNVPHRKVVTALKQAVRTANQSIADRNDAAQRQDRHRMGTTIVIALVYGARLYIAHLGDSRAYRVRSHNCRQITLDDDVAAREMRLGLELYQDALQNPGSGALVQALGMADSSHLRPTVKLYPIATDSLFLLCSDGLSDNNLIEHLWPTELTPVLRGDRDVATAGKRLIDLANTYNGHDNVTVGLLRLLPHPASTGVPVPLEIANLLLAPAPPTKTPERVTQVAAPRAVTQNLPPAPTTWRPLPVLVSSLFVAGLLGGIGALSWQWYSRRATEPVPETESGETLSPSATPPRSSAVSPDVTLAVGDYLQIRQLPDPSAGATLLDTANPPVPPPSPAVDIPERLLPVGSIVQVRSRQKTPDDQLWVRLAVCSVATAAGEATTTPNPATSSGEPGESTEANINFALPLAQPGDEGWLLETDLPIFAEQVLDTTTPQQGSCTD